MKIPKSKPIYWGPCVIVAVFFILVVLTNLTRAQEAPDGVEFTASVEVILTTAKPTQSADGSALDDFSHYLYSEGKTSGNYTEFYTESDIDVLQKVIKYDITEDVEFFYIAQAVDINGNISDPSEEFSKSFTLDFVDTRPPKPIPLDIDTANDTCITDTAEVTCTVVVE